MIRRVGPLLLLALLAAPVAAETEAEVRALGQALHDADLERAAVAARRLRTLGAAAEPATGDLIQALDRVLPEQRRRAIWDPWQNTLVTYRRDVLAALVAIGPKAEAGLPKILHELDGARGYPDREIDWLVRPLFDDWRGQVPGVKAGLLRWARRGNSGVTDSLWQRIRAWLVSLGPEAYPVWDAWLASRVRDDGFAVRVLNDEGDAGLPLLQKHFDRDRALQDRMLRTWIQAGHLPPFAREQALDRLATETMEQLAPAIVTILAAMDADLAPQLAARLVPERFHWNTWRALSSHGGAFGRRVGQHWFDAHGPKPRPQGFDGDGRRATVALGGPGGGTFRETPGGLLVGLRYTYELVNWAPAIRSIQGLYWQDGRMSEGKVYGKHGAKRGTVMSKPGYAIGGLYAQHGARFQGFAVVYMRHLDGRLDPKDAYIDTWHGSSITGHTETCLAGEGYDIVGIHGRTGADIDALGLIERRSP